VKILAPMPATDAEGAGPFVRGEWLAHRSASDGVIISHTMGQWLMGWLSAAGYYGAHGVLRDTVPARLAPSARADQFHAELVARLNELP